MTPCRPHRVIGFARKALLAVQGSLRGYPLVEIDACSCYLNDTKEERLWGEVANLEPCSGASSETMVSKA